MVEAGDGARLRGQPQTHVDVSNLGHRGIGDHPPQVPFLDSAHGAHDHPGDAEHEQHVDHPALPDHLESHHPVENLDQQKDIPLGHQRGQDGRRRQRRIPIGVRQPGVEGIQGALDGQPHGHQPQRHHQGDVVLPRGRNELHLLPDIAHQQMPRHGIQIADAQKQQPGAQQAHDHVPGGRLEGPPGLADHDQPAGGYGIDLHEHIGSEQIVGIDQGQQGAQQQVHHHIVQVALPLLNLGLPLPDAPQHAQQHDDTEEAGQKGLQDAHPDLIAPGRGEMAHQVHIGPPGGYDVSQYKRRHDSDYRNHGHVHPSGPFPVQYGAQGPGKQGQQDGHEREILHESHHFPSFFSLVVISSRSRV